MLDRCEVAGGSAAEVKPMADQNHSFGALNSAHIWADMTCGRLQRTSESLFQTDDESVIP